jgi:hypothetical protein
MKKMFIFLTLFILVVAACDMSAPPTTGPSPTSLPLNSTILPTEVAVEVPSNTVIPTSEVPVEIPNTPEPAFEGIPVFFQPLSLLLPPDLANGISGAQFPRVDGADVPYWELTPGHTIITLDGYLLDEKFHQPQIYVYPATGYADLFSGAFESMHRLRNVMSDPSMTSVDKLPAVPFFNAAQVFASNVQPVSFQNGDGIRFLTEYAQYAVPVNNHELIYHYQGFTRDGEYYVIAIFPITVQVLAETEDPGAVLPSGGVAYPDTNDPNADFQSYYAAITALLNAASPNAFSPMISQLDQLIESLQVAP